MQYIKGFDGLRAVSILFVILSHLGIYHFLPDNDFIRTRVWLLFNGETGVLIFFNLSGFLITLILLKEKVTKGKINFKRFFIKRFLRLLPPFALFSITLLLLKLIGLLNFTFEGFIMSFLYCYNYAPTRFYHDELVHTWSLAVEEQFYLIWPFVIHYFNKTRIHIFIFILISLSLATLYIIKLEYLIEFRRPDRWFIPAAASILIGGLTALAITFKYHRIISYFNSSNSFIFSTILFLFPIYSLKYILFLSPICMSFGIASFIGWIYFHQETRCTNFLNINTLRYIGKISYGIYVYQGLFLKTGPGGNLFIQQFPQNLILTMITAVISYEILEKPFLKLKSKFSN